MMSTVSFYTNVVSGNTIDLATAVTVLLLFDKITNPMVMLPIIVGNTLELIVSLKRIQTFLDSSELIVENFRKQKQSVLKYENGQVQEHSVIINKTNFSWGLKSEEEDDDDKKKEEEKKNKKSKKEKKQNVFTEDEKKESKTVSIDSLVVLKDIELKVKKGEFVCIIGDVGAGKSSILSAIIGDLIPVNKL